jgi:hypothetical protein
MRLVDPYTPGAGKMPSCLAGRKELVENAKLNIQATIKGYPQNPVIYYGLRGVGKTVLLNAIEKEADDLPVICEHIEIAERGSFIRQIAISSQKMLRELSVLEAAKEAVGKLKSVFTSFYVTYNPEDSSFTAGLSERAAYGVIGNLSEDLTELIVSLGKTAEKAGRPICFFVDEIQYMKKSEMEALINALHRSNQLRLPIVFYGAGLPKILRIFGEVKSYSERLFQFVEVDNLKEKDASEAVIQPAKDFEVSYEKVAVQKILEQTQGYPYFIQALCSTIWRKTSSDVITGEDVIKNEPIYLEDLDKSFFKVRFDRCTKREQEFLFAMVKCGELPCTIANVAHFMDANVKMISPIRATLIDKGIIYAAGHGEIDFTVPQFDSYLRRVKTDL